MNKRICKKKFNQDILKYLKVHKLEKSDFVIFLYSGPLGEAEINGLEEVMKYLRSHEIHGAVIPAYIDLRVHRTQEERDKAIKAVAEILEDLKRVSVIANDCFTDEVGGYHDSGIGWNPQGHWCGECTKSSCVGCPNEKLPKEKQDE